MRIKWFSTILVICLIWYLAIYIVNCIGNWNEGYSSYIDMAVFLSLSISYLLMYRKEDILCFEFLFIPVFFLGIFFTDVVLDVSGVGVGGIMDNVVTESSYIFKSRIIQMTAFVIFLLGCSYSNNKRINNSYNWNNYRVLNKEIDYKTVSLILSIILLIILVYDYLSGVFDTWFAYRYGLSDAERNQGLGHINALCLMITLTEFSRLSKDRVDSFRLFLKKSSPLYLLEIGFVSLLLLLSGNRNEMLLVFLPMVVAYNIFIKHIRSKYVLLGLVAGTLIMIYIGLTRQGDSIKEQERTLYSATRDYSVLGYNCTYLIKYTDEHNPCYFAGLPFTLVSGIPMAGPALIKASGLEYKNTSSSITTSGLTSIYSETGLGTSLVGDLYYNAKFPFVVIYMFLFGLFIAKLHNRFSYEKKYNLALLLIYIYMVSNAVYYIRSMWDFPIKDFIYDSILLYALCLLFQKRQKHKNINIQ